MKSVGYPLVVVTLFLFVCEAAAVIGTDRYGYKISNFFPSKFQFFLINFFLNPYKLALILVKQTRTKHNQHAHLSWYWLGCIFHLSHENCCSFVSTYLFICFSIYSYAIRHATLVAAKALHNMILARLMHAPMSFFDTTPVGTTCVNASCVCVL
jgi:hypothetical protein